MRGITGGRLEHLGRQAIGVAREKIAERWRLLFRLLEVSDLHPQERSWKLHFGPCEGRQPAPADDSADGAFAADEGRFDREPIPKHDEVRNEARSAREIDGANRIAGLVDDLPARP